MRSTSEGLTCRRYEAERKQEWDAFVAGAKNATFLFRRAYMDYHSGRFADHSVVVYNGDRLVGALPANEESERLLVSHGGLTYGGLAVPVEVTLTAFLRAFGAVLGYCADAGFRTLRYKRMPSFYNAQPDDEIAYAMFLLDAHPYRVDTSVVVPRSRRLATAEQRRRALKRANRSELRVVDGLLREFWLDVLEPNLLSRHGVSPVHTVDEIGLLKERFPAHIHQFGVVADDELVGGATIYETDTVAHAQYIAATDHGRQVGALDFLFEWLISERFAHKDYFDFGISNEREGRLLNADLVRWKEGFGGRVMSSEFYEVETSRHDRLAAAIKGHPVAG